MCTKIKNFIEKNWPYFWIITASLISIVFYFITKDTASAVLIGTAVVIIWYSIETYLLRRATEGTIEMQRTPFLTLNLHNNVVDMYISIENIGQAIARHIRFVPFSLEKSEMNYIFQLEGTNDFLYPAPPGQGRTERVGLIARRNDRGTLAESQYRVLYTDISKYGPAYILLYYRNPIGELYHSVYRLSSNSSHVFSPKFELVTAGKGEINFIMAQEHAGILDQTHASTVLDSYISQRHPESPL